MTHVLTDCQKKSGKKSVSGVSPTDYFTIVMHGSIYVIMMRCMTSLLEVTNTTSLLVIPNTASLLDIPNTKLKVHYSLNNYLWILSKMR